MAGPTILIIDDDKTPVVMTASSDPKLEAEAKSHGAAGFLRKPVDPSALKALVEELVGPPGSAAE